MCHCSSVMSRMGARGPWPALLTSTSARPQRSIVPSTSRLRSPTDWLEQVTPKPPNSPANASPFPEKDRMATLKPSADNLRAASAPIPLPPAVTIATLFTVIEKPLRNSGLGDAVPDRDDGASHVEAHYADPGRACLGIRGRHSIAQLRAR